MLADCLEVVVSPFEELIDLIDHLSVGGLARLQTRDLAVSGVREQVFLVGFDFAYRLVVVLS